MDDQTSLLLNWTHIYHQDKSTDDELRQSLLLTMELEEELKNRDEEIAQLRQLINEAIRERDEAQDKCQKVLYEKILLQQQLRSTLHSGISSIDQDYPNTNNGVFSSSDSDESIVSSPPPPPPELPMPLNKPLPEKGKLLQAVMKAGPLLQTLLLAGPLPQWRHPPPPLDTYQIPPPPVVIPPTFHQYSSLNSNEGINKCGSIIRKRGPPESSDSFKYQRVLQ